MSTNSTTTAVSKNESALGAGNTQEVKQLENKKKAEEERKKQIMASLITNESTVDVRNSTSSAAAASSSVAAPQSLFKIMSQAVKKESPYPPGYLIPSSIGFHTYTPKKENTKVLAPLYSDYSESKFEWSFDNEKKMEVLKAAKGVFSFGLFRNYLDLKFKADLYREGISKYIELTKRKAFEGYAIVVYVDESVINTQVFSNQDYFNELLEKYLISRRYESKADFEHKKKYIYNKAIENKYVQTLAKLDNDYITRVKDLQSKITNQKSAEMIEEMKKLNEEFKQLYFTIKEKNQAEQEEFRKNFFSSQIKEQKPLVEKDIENLIIKTKKLLDVLQSTPNCILCKYTIPTFLIPGTPFHYNYIGSMVRFQAIAEFPNKRVCVRDADTYFSNLWEEPYFRFAYAEEYEKNSNNESSTQTTQSTQPTQSAQPTQSTQPTQSAQLTQSVQTTQTQLSKENLNKLHLKQWKAQKRKQMAAEKERISLRTDIANHYVEYLEAWEVNLEKYHGQKSLPFLIAYDTLYHFTNKRKKDKKYVVNSRFLAGIVDAFPHDQNDFTQQDWEEGVKFIRDDDVIYNIRGNKNYYPEERKQFKEYINSKGSTYYGCDEKVLRYIYFEKWKGKVVLFYFPYAHGNNLLLYSEENEETSFLNALLKLLDASLSEQEKQSSLYKFILNEASRLYRLPYFNRFQGGQYYPFKDYYFFAPSYPFIADQLALISDNDVEDNIKPFLKGGSIKTRKRRNSKVRKSRKH